MQMRTTPIASKTKAALDVFRKDLIGVGSWAFSLIDSGANFVSVRGGVSQNRPTWGAEINPFIFFRFLTIEYAHYTESMGQEVGDRTNARDVIQLRFAF